MSSWLTKNSTSHILVAYFVATPSLPKEFPFLGIFSLLQLSREPVRRKTVDIFGWEVVEVYARVNTCVHVRTCVHVCACVYVCVHVCVWVWRQRRPSGVEDLSLSFSTSFSPLCLFSETESLAESGTPQELQMCSTVPSFYVCARDLNSDLHTCKSTLPIVPTPSHPRPKFGYFKDPKWNTILTLFINSYLREKNYTYRHADIFIDRQGYLNKGLRYTA